jgi:diguanylate cyclase (GGDEF)-like protein
MFFRVGGDEFAILVTDSTEDDMVGLARRILTRITELKFRFGGEEARLTASVGIALYPEHGGSARELMEHSDQAMYRAKSGGKNGWQIWRARAA